MSPFGFFGQGLRDDALSALTRQVAARRNRNSCPLVHNAECRQLAQMRSADCIEQKGDIAQQSAYAAGRHILIKRFQERRSVESSIRPVGRPRPTDMARLLSGRHGPPVFSMRVGAFASGRRATRILEIDSSTVSRL